MGGLVIVTVRPGVQFTPDAAAAFMRADARVVAEYGRHIGVNSTYRSWSDQMIMFVNWGKYVSGKGPHPGHSKAVHPSESFHVQGVALDSDDWRVPGIVSILADNGFIRNRLHVPNENHHFEWIRSRDNHYGEPILAGGATAAPPPRPLPIGDETMFIRALSAGAWARKGVIYSNDMQGHWRGLSNLEGNGYVLPLVEQGKLPFAEFNGTDLDLLFSLNGVWEQATINPNTSPKWGDGTPLIGLGALTGKLIYPGTTGWQYPIAQTPPDVKLVDDDA